MSAAPNGRTSIDLAGGMHAQRVPVLIGEFHNSTHCMEHFTDLGAEFRQLEVDFLWITKQVDPSAPMGKAMYRHRSC